MDEGTRADMYQEMYVAVAEKWGALLERYDLDPDSSAADVIAAAEARASQPQTQPLTLDVERLARALDSVPFDSEMTQGTLAGYIAGEYERVGQVAVALHEKCLLEWQAKDALSPGRDQTMHMADAHYGEAEARASQPLTLDVERAHHEIGSRDDCDWCAAYRERTAGTE